jgi:serine/threonine-protein kinase
MQDAATVSLRPVRDARATATDHGAVPRLRLLAAMYAIATTAVMLVLRLDDIGWLRLPPEMPRGTAALSVPLAGSILLVAVTRSKLSARRILGFGAAYQIAGAVSVAWFEQAHDIGRGTAGTVMWIMTYTLLPTRPVRTALVAGASALAGPLALVAHVALGDRSWPSDFGVALDFGMTAVVAVFVTVMVRVIYGLGREIADARHIGSYVLVEKLGHGGMGEVWRATHSSLARPAAVKLMRPRDFGSGMHLDLAQLTRRFHREAQATAMLKSPHTVAVYDFGQTQDGALYYAMELLDGLDLESLVTRHGPQPAERVIHFLRQAAASLAEAHVHGLVHRDVKPANIYASVAGLELDFVKVLDFGLVRRISGDPALTAEQGVWGTPSYMAPETAAGNRFDARSDIYALGAVGYWLLTGKTVFDAATGNAMIAAQIRDTPVRPSLRTELPVPAALEAVILACLAKDPDARPQTAEQLSRMLAAVPAQAWTQRRAEAWWRANQPDALGRANAVWPAAEPSACELRTRIIAEAA